MTRPLNGCMCQDGTCESCNRVVEAWEAMAQACAAAIRYDHLIMGRAFQERVINRGNVTTAEGDDLDAAYANWIGKSRTAHKLADEAAKGKP